MKILYVIADSSRTGAPHQVYYLLRGIREHHEVACICPLGWLAEEAQRLGVETHVVQFENRGQTIREVAELYDQMRPDLIHCHGVRGGLIGRLASRRGRWKVVYTEHLWTEDFHLPSRLREVAQLASLRQLSQMTVHTVAVSEAVKRFLLRRKIVQEGKISVIQGAIEQQPLAKPTEGIVIGTLGSLLDVKGVDVLIRAFAEVYREFPEARCRIGGAGSVESKYKKLADGLGVASKIDWVGEVVDKTGFFDGLMLYVQPSRSESFGLAVLEAMSAGLPVVASDAGALPEIVEDRVTGLLFKKEDASGLAVALRKLIADDGLRSALSVAGKARAAEFTPERFVEKHLELYQKLH